MQKARVGNVEIVALSDGTQGYPAASVYPGAGDRLADHSASLSADGKVEMNFGCLLVRADGTTVLVDTGLGPESKGQLMDDLRAAGVANDEIDLVLFTHLHGDHTGWNIDRESGKPSFGKARYLVPKGDWDHYAAQGRGSFKRDILPLEAVGCLDLIAGEHAVSPSLTAIPTPGHTPGHTSLVIDSDGERGLILGDVVISPVDALNPRWDNSFDWDHDVARSTRLSLLWRLEREGALVGASHLPAPGLGRFVRVQGRRRWQAM